MMNGPDGLTGAIMAVESIPGAAALLHGPAGCRIRNSLLSMSLVPREDRGYGDFTEPFFAGYSRVPASYIDAGDHIDGAVGRLERALGAVLAKGPDLVVVIDAPGASLMADDHRRAVRSLDLPGDVMVLEESTMSAPPAETYGRTLAAVIRHLSPVRGSPRPGTVNLLGLTVADASWEAVLGELSSYLEDMGLTVACAPGAGASADDLVSSADSELCAVVCEEACWDLIGLYRDMGLEVVVPSAGAPVGFDATRSWILEVAAAAGRDPSPALSRLERSEEAVDRRLGGMRYEMMRVRGMTFSAAGPASALRPLAGWLCGFLSMVPSSLVPEGDPAALREAVSSLGFPDAVSRRLGAADIVLCDGNTALRMRCSGRCSVAVSTGWAVLGSDGLIPRPVYGATGAVHLLDAVLEASHGR